MNSIFLKAAQFCAYQERTQAEVREKLNELGCYGDDAESIIAELILENYINEERFAKAFAGGKFRLKKWGRIKIEYELRQKGLSEYCIRKGMEEIEDEAYHQSLEDLLAKKKKSLKETSQFILQKKLAQFAISKGYESSLVWEKLKTKTN